MYSPLSTSFTHCFFLSLHGPLLLDNNDHKHSQPLKVKVVDVYIFVALFCVCSTLFHSSHSSTVFRFAPIVASCACFEDVFYTSLSTFVLIVKKRSLWDMVFGEHCSDPNGFVYYAVNVEIIDSSKRSGIRRRIYLDAGQLGAFYSTHGAKYSICYNGESPNLSIHLFFCDEQTAGRFVNTLMTYSENQTSSMYQKVRLCEAVKPVKVAVKSALVLVSDYNFENSNSPAMTVDQTISDTTNVPVTNDPVLRLRTCCNFDRMAPAEPLFRCHIAPKAFFNEFANNNDNIIYGDGLFHSYFDGDGKRLPGNKGTIPQFKIEFVKDDAACTRVVGGLTFFKVIVRFQFLESNVRDALMPHLVEGSSIDGELSILTFFFTTNISNCERFINLKKVETESRWLIPDDE